ncbi:MAG: UDP-glucose 4-epimerase GalE [Maricaulaceae bacterium]|jgi:UDP-arabinose 4-epimerase
MKVMVTGGAGYVGSHACKALAAGGHDVVVFDNLDRGHREFVQWGELIEGDLCDGPAIAAALERVRPDAVIHFAALAYVGESVENPSLYYRNNVVGTLNLLEAMRAAGVNKLVFSSTCATYGEPESVPISEDHPQAPINPYGASKLMVERILKDYDNAHGVRSVALRYFNAAGADPEGQIGEWHEPETHLIPLAIDAAIHNPTAIKVFGTDYPTPDGTAIRDYIHVVDLADAHVRALDYLNAGGRTDAFNLGTGTGTSVMEILNAVEEVSGVRLKPQLGPRRAGDPPRLVAEASKAKSALGWTPARSDIGQIIADAWAWHRRLEVREAV